MDRIQKDFLSVDDDFRPLCYWGWLENMRDDETAFQVEQMHAAGLGGYVAHARGGLEVKYMGSEWQSSVLTAIETGKKYGMLSIMDDEDGWPSGFGAGEVNGRGDFYHQKRMYCEEKAGGDIKVTPRTLGVYKKTADGFEPQNINAPLCGETLIHIYYETDKYYVDLSDPTVTQAFIDSSYEKYKSLCGEKFGRGMWGVFSDEPQLSRDHMLWSYSLPAEFMKNCGYNLTDKLPYLYYDLPDSDRVRHDYYKTSADMFAENYARPLGEWCEENGLVFTGHTCLEENFHGQISCSGNTMPFYEYFTVPGIDWLCRIRVENVLIKQLTSVALQLNKPRILSEMYGCAGWNVSFEELRWIGMHHSMYGVDLMLQHLGLYSLKGQRKREYPAALFYQQPWWNKFAAFNEYFARLNKLINQSAEELRVLVIHPMETAWALKNDKNVAVINEYSRSYNAFLDNLLYMGVNFHLGDSTIMQRYGQVNGSTLRVGHCEYDIVIIPEGRNIAKSTADMLLSYAANGGKLISVGEFPAKADGSAYPLLSDLKKRAISVSGDPQTLRDTLPAMCGVAVCVKMADGSANKNINLVTRIYKNQKFHIFFNASHSESGAFSACGVAKQCAALDFETMQYRAIDTENITLAPMEPVIIVEDAQAQLPSIPPSDAVYESVQTLDMFEIVECSQNALTLDSCRYSFNGGEIMPQTSVNLIQSGLIHGGKDCDVTLYFNFNMEYVPQNELYLIMEEPHRCRITLNGETLDGADCGYYVDKSFKKLDISGKARIGDNEIVISRRFENNQHTYDIKNGTGIHEAEANRTTVQTEIEAVYILGNFSVDFNGSHTPGGNGSFFAKGTFSIAEPKTHTPAACLTKDGFPFFSGHITLKADFCADKENGKRTILDLGNPDCILSEVLVNGNSKLFQWAPYRCDITDWVNCGQNQLQITLYTSNRNLLGPLHNREGEPYGVGPHSYAGNQIEDTETFALVPFGLPASVRIGCGAQGCGDAQTF